MLCRMAGFKAGLIFLYENLRLFREVLQVRSWDHHLVMLTISRAHCSLLGSAVQGWGFWNSRVGRGGHLGKLSVIVRSGKKAETHTGSAVMPCPDRGALHTVHALE